MLALQFAGPFVSGLVMVVLGLAALGERQIRVLLGTIAFSTLVLGMVFQVWH